MKSFRFFSIFLALWLAIAPPVRADGLLDNTITISEFKIHPNGAGEQIDSWPWLDMGSYYNIILGLMMQPLFLGDRHDTPDMTEYHIVETMPDGRAVREFLLRGDTNAYIYHSYDDTFYRGGDQVRAYLETLRPLGPGNNVDEKNIVYIYDYKDLRVFVNNKDSAKKLESLLTHAKPMDINSPTPKFLEEKTTHIKWMRDKPNAIPQEVAIDGDVMRYSNFTTQDHVFFDILNMKKQAAGQKKLRDHYRSIGIPNPIPRF